MAIVVENGSIVSGANSYASEAELTSYASDRGVTISGTNSELLIKSMDYLETLVYQGEKKTEDQPLQWPREGVWVDGFYIESTKIPAELVDAQLALSLTIDGGNDPLSTIDRATKREKLDVLEVEYMDNAAAAPIIRKVTAKLRKLLRNATSGSSFVVIRS